MAKQKTSFRCTNCAHVSAKWVGCCPGCAEWNSFVEQAQVLNVFSSKNISFRSAEIVPADLFQLDDIKIQTNERMLSGIKEWDRVLGGGILPGSFLILTGDPGIGKSTLLLQVANCLASSHDVIYFSSEESLQQVKNRAMRLNVNAPLLKFSDQSYLDGIIATAKMHLPKIIILDSIQNCHLSPESHAVPGTIAQLREAGFVLMRLAKENNVAVLITGHITKEGQMAGPKVLEHMVDGVFYLQGEDRWQSRILRSVKNRFGTINEVGFFEMREEGLEEIANINQHLLGDAAQVPGSALVCSVEGSRPLLLELQSLCIQSKFGMPQRVVTGMDPKRIVLIAAILEKYLYIKFSMQDIFFKVSGGFKIKESSSDLGIALALLSSYFQKPLPIKSLALAEISLTGQIKPANQVGMCVKEAEKFGIETIFVSHSQTGIKASCSVVSFRSVYELLRIFPDDV